MAQLFHPRQRSPRMGSRGQPEESRAAILKAATQEFSKHGIAGARTDAIAVDGSGNAYVTRFTSSSKFPVTGGAYQKDCGAVINNQTNCPSAQSAFLTKLSPNGSLVYSTFLGHLNETGIAVAVDSQGRAYVAGNSSANCTTAVPTCFPTTANAVLPGSAFNGTLSPGAVASTIASGSPRSQRRRL